MSIYYIAKSNYCTGNPNRWAINYKKKQFKKTFVRRIFYNANLKLREALESE